MNALPRVHYLHTRFTLVIRRHCSTDSVYRHRLSVCTRLHCSGKRKQVSLGIRYTHLARIYTLCKRCVERSKRAHVRARQAWPRAAPSAFAPSSFRLAAFSSSRFKRSCPGYRGEHARSVGYKGARMPPGHPVVFRTFYFSLFLSLFVSLSVSFVTDRGADKSKRTEKVERKKLVDYKEIDFIINIINFLTTLSSTLKDVTRLVFPLEFF